MKIFSSGKRTLSTHSVRRIVLFKMLLKTQNSKLFIASCAFWLTFNSVCECTTIIEKVDNYVHRARQFSNLNMTISTDFIQPSLFPNVPPYIKFAPYYQTPNVEIPAPVRDGLLWRRSLIMDSGGNIVHYIMNKTGLPALKLSDIQKLEPQKSWFGYWHTIYTSTLIGPLIITQPYQKYSFFQKIEELEHKDKQHWNLMRI